MNWKRAVFGVLAGCIMTTIICILLLNGVWGIWVTNARVHNETQPHAIQEMVQNTRQLESFEAPKLAIPSRNDAPKDDRNNDVIDADSDEKDSEEPSAEVEEAKMLVERWGNPGAVVSFDITQLIKFLKSEVNFVVDESNQELMSALHSALSKARTDRDVHIKNYFSMTKEITRGLGADNTVISDPENATKLIKDRAKNRPISVVTQTEDDGVRRTRAIDSKQFPELFEFKNNWRRSVAEGLIEDSLKAIREYRNN